jgi:glycerol-3-phosphate dehydrogenase
MRRVATEVLVIGGGATGAGVVRDAAMRGFEAILVERRDLSHGTTGRYHGLLHSGGRYVVKDPEAARECIEENRVLRRIMPHCIEDTGGYFVVTPWDDLDYVPKFVDGCITAGIPVEEVPIGQMLREEPLLNPKISVCLRVPDASADSFLATEATAASAREHGSTILTYHEVTEVVRDGDRVVGARCHDLVSGEDLEIAADLVVNASGAWAGKIAGTVGLDVQVLAGKGTMVAINHRVVNTVVNRCKMPADGDIIVPIHTVAVVGTTDDRVTDPDHFAIEPWEIRLIIEEGARLVPELPAMRILRAWAGVRPLYQETSVADTRDVTRAYTLLDHSTRDGVDGMITITGGKWTSYRQMAEVTVDRVCAKLGTDRACRTHVEVLPDPEQHDGPRRYHRLGARLARIEADEAFGELICECELVTRSDVQRSIIESEARTLDDVRRDTRVGMGPCQGGFCAYRVAALLHELRSIPIEDANVALRDFLQERWKGELSILWGQQLRQERLDELIYLSLFDTEHLPGPRSSNLGPSMYEEFAPETTS